MALLGNDTQTGRQVVIGDIERRSGLYVLGRPGFGKSTLLCNILLQDYEKGYSAFFLDPHGDAIDTILARLPGFDNRTIYLLDPIDDEYKFGINPLYCRDVTKAADRRAAYNKTLAIFKRLWEQDNQWGVWLQLVLENALPVLIETGYTLADMPLFLNNKGFREFLLQQVKYSGETLDFWQYEFKQEQAQPALVRVRSLLGDADVRLIIGQQKTTINFSEFTGQPGKYLFLKIPQNMAEDAKRFIGTIITTELLHAIRNRSEEAKQYNYSLFIDEFQHYVADLDTFILETRKYACAISLAHQERLGQFGENQKILGATLACANKVLFQTTVKDARELAPEFAEQPTVMQTRRVPEMVICKDPMWHLLQTGHANPRIMEIFRAYLEPFFIRLNQLKDEGDTLTLQRSGHFDQAMLSRDQSGLSGIAQENRMNAAARGRDLLLSNSALNRSEAFLQQAMQHHGLAEKTLQEMGSILRVIQMLREEVRKIERLFVSIMETGRVPGMGTETLAQFLIYTTTSMRIRYQHLHIYELYILTKYGDPKEPRELVVWNTNVPFVRKYFYEMAQGLYLADKMDTIQKHNANPNTRHPYSKERIAESLEKYRDEFAKGYEIWLNKPQQIHYQDLYFGVLSEQERAYLQNACYETICEQPENDEFFQAIDDMLELCQLLTQAENHILVSSGQYVEKPVQIATTAEMVNQAVQTLTDLPRYTAAAKIISEENDKQTVWKGQIETKELSDPDNGQNVQERIIERTREMCCRPRLEIEQEIAARRSKWRNTGARGDTPSRKPTSRKTPPPSWG